MMRRNRELENLDQDIRDHIEQETRENIERGMSPDQARRGPAKVWEYHPGQGRHSRGLDPGLDVSFR